MIDRGSKQPENQNTQEANDIFLRRVLSSYPVWQKDHDVLARRMAAEMGKGQPWILWRKTMEFRFNPAILSCIGTAMILVSFLVGFYLLIFPINSPVQRIEFISQETWKSSTPSWFWKMKISHGKRVRIPDGMQANLWLADGSRMQCSPGSTVSLHFHNDRIITLDSKRIRIQAAHIPDSCMIVKTPLSDVKVTGTVFWVEIVN